MLRLTVAHSTGSAVRLRTSIECETPLMSRCVTLWRSGGPKFPRANAGDSLDRA